MIPPEEDAEFVVAMEEVLDLYQKPLDTDVPVVNMDEQSVLLRDNVRDPCSAKPGQVVRVDNEYKRNGTVSLFLFTAGTFWLAACVCARASDCGGLGGGGKGAIGGGVSDGKASDFSL